MRRVLKQERAESDRTTMRAIRRVSSLLTAQVIPHLPDNTEADEETGSQDEHDENHDSDTGSDMLATRSAHAEDGLKDDGNSVDDIRTAEVPQQMIEAFVALYRTSSPDQAEALAAFFTAVSEELRQRDDGRGDEDRTRELGAAPKEELTARLKVAPAAGKPLSGVMVPGVDLQRGTQGGAVKQLQSALVKAGVMTQAQMNTGPGVFGPQTLASLKKFQQAHGVEAVGAYGPKTRAAFVRLGAKVAAAPHPPAPAGVRKKIVAEGKWGANNKARIHYQQKRPIEGLKQPHKLPLNIDCSGFVTLCYKWAGAPDPNGNGYNGAGYTGTLEAHMRHIPQSKLQPGDLCLWKGKHVSLVVQTGADPLLISHGEESGPYAIRFSAQKRGFRGTPLIWLTSPTGNRAFMDRAVMPFSAEDATKSDPPAEQGISDEDIVPLPPDL
jgi:cell wall-associated NlpC family hydrolase